MFSVCLLFVLLFSNKQQNKQRALGLLKMQQREAYNFIKTFGIAMFSKKTKGYSMFSKKKYVIQENKAKTSRFPKQYLFNPSAVSILFDPSFW
jgi:hypothetical protein